MKKTSIAMAALSIVVVLLILAGIWTNMRLQAAEVQVNDLQAQLSAVSIERDALRSERDVLRNERNALQTEISVKEADIKSLQSQVNQLQTNLAALTAERDALQSQVNTWNDIALLKMHATIIEKQTINQPARYYTRWSWQAPYAGYITVQVHSSTTDTTYVQVLYSVYVEFQGAVHFDQTVNVGIGGKAVFPVLPSINGNPCQIEIRVGNSNLLTGATEVVSVVYHY